MIKLRQSHTKNGYGGQIYYVPELNKTEAAIMHIGHHSVMDGTTSAQGINLVSDDPFNSEYPFFERPRMSLLQWAFMYITAPIAWILVRTYYNSHRSDKNCIKKHKVYMKGEFTFAKSKLISMSKAKALSKNMNITFNDMMLGMTSKVLKQYFVMNNDHTETITLAVPMTFKLIPKKVEDYTYGNQFVSLTIYLKLMDNFWEASQ